ncbi:MAG: alpha/beta hydrolase [Pseudomonadota bacterium]
MSSLYRSQLGEDQVLKEYRALLDTWPVPYKSKHISTEYGSTFVIESGLEDNPPLLLLHGSVSNSLSWMGDVEWLCKTHRVFAVDIIGEAGFSDPSRPAYERGAYADWLGELSTSLGYSELAVVGMSLGGWMALDFATRHPERVTRLGLICTSGIVRESRTFVFKAVFYMLLGEWGKRRILAMVNGGKEPDSQGMADAFEFFGLVGEHFRPRTGKLPIFADAVLTKLTMPVLAIAGEKDALIPAQPTLSRLSGIAPNVTVVLLPDTGHIITNQAERLALFLNQ